MRIHVITIIGILTARFALAAVPSYNQTFIGTWKGLAPTKNLCSGGKLNQNGEREISLTIEKPRIVPGKNYQVLLRADWGCFSEMTIPGFIFADEFWAASADRMTFVRLKLTPDGKIAGDFRFDLNSHTLAMSFKEFRKVSGE